jgi:hypothetical protein
MDDSIRQIEKVEKVIGPLISGVFFLVLGYKIYNPFKGRNTPQKEAEFYKYGKFLKIAGYLLLGSSLIALIVLLLS